MGKENFLQGNTTMFNDFFVEQLNRIGNGDIQLL